MAYDESKAMAICERLADGEPMAQICRDEGMPKVTTVWEWEKQHVELAETIARARIDGFESIAADTLQIADDGRNDWMDKHDPDNPGYAFNGEHVQRSKLRIETRLKLLAKWDPRRYGDRTALELTGANGSDLFANLGKAELLAELSRRMSTPEIARALQSLQHVQPGALPALPGVATKDGKG